MARASLASTEKNWFYIIIFYKFGYPGVILHIVGQRYRHAWRTNISLMDKLKDEESRIWYAYKVIENGWSKTILDLQIESRLMERTGRSVNNFPAALPPADSDLVNQVFKDPYLFDFLGTDMPRREIEIERQLTEHIQSFLLELGQGFAFVGRQVHLEVGGDDFYLDLLF